MPSAEAKSLPVPRGTMPKWTASSALTAAMPFTTSFSVPSPPATKIAEQPSVSACCAACSASPSPWVKNTSAPAYLRRSPPASVAACSTPRSRPDDGLTMSRARGEVIRVSRSGRDPGSGRPVSIQTARRDRVPSLRGASAPGRSIPPRRASTCPRPSGGSPGVQGAGGSPRRVSGRALQPSAAHRPDSHSTAAASPTSGAVAPRRVTIRPPGPGGCRPRASPSSSASSASLPAGFYGLSPDAWVFGPSAQSWCECERRPGSGEHGAGDDVRVEGRAIGTDVFAVHQMIDRCKRRAALAAFAYYKRLDGAQQRLRRPWNRHVQRRAQRLEVCTTGWLAIGRFLRRHTAGRAPGDTNRHLDLAVHVTKRLLDVLFEVAHDVYQVIRVQKGSETHRHDGLRPPRRVHDGAVLRPQMHVGHRRRFGATFDHREDPRRALHRTEGPGAHPERRDRCIDDRDDIQRHVSVAASSPGPPRTTAPRDGRRRG